MVASDTDAQLLRTIERLLYDEADCLDPLLAWVPDETQRRMILADNPAALYGFDD